MRQKIMPDYLLAEDPHAAYVMRYHNQPPANYKLRVAQLLGGRCVCCGENQLWLRIWRESGRPANIQLMCKCCNSHGKQNQRECSFKIIARHVAFMLRQADRAA